MISTVVTLNLQQASAFGFVERQQIVDFLRLTAQFDLFPSKTARSKVLKKIRIRNGLQLGTNSKVVPFQCDLSNDVVN